MTEIYKGGCHATAFGLSLVLFAYNLGELLEKRDREHALNSALYGALCAWEFRQILKHVKRGP